MMSDIAKMISDLAKVILPLITNVGEKIVPLLLILVAGYLLFAFASTDSGLKRTFGRLIGLTMFWFSFLVLLFKAMFAGEETWNLLKNFYTHYETRTSTALEKIEKF